MAVPLFVFADRRQSVQPRTRKTLEKLSESEIRQHCGLPWWGVRELIELYEPIEGERSTSIPLETKVLCFLSQLRSGSFQWVVGSSVGIAQSTVSKSIKDCLDHTLTFAREVIQFPNAVEDLNVLKQSFYAVAKVPNVIGIVDGTHVPIRSPSIDEPTYVNRKQYHSVNCQIVADKKYRILDVVAKWGGSIHDSYVWKNSSIRQRLYDGDFGDGHFLGDSGYPLEPKLLVPYPNPTDVPHEILFNGAIRKTRSIVERAIGNWKSRFRSMDRTGGFSCYEVSKVCKFIVASVAIHNICVNNEIPIIEEDIEHRDNIVIPNLQAHTGRQDRNSTDAAKTYRNTIAENLSRVDGQQ